MSRSYRKTPIIGIAGDSEKQDKKIANARFRKKERQALQQYRIDNIPHDLNDVSNVWSMSKDGKQYLNPDGEYFKSGKWRRK
jgi:hypothetical protein